MFIKEGVFVSCKMTYLQDKKSAYCLINSMFRDGKKASVVVFTVQTRYGFGSKMVYERIKLLMEFSSSEAVKLMKKG